MKKMTTYFVCLLLILCMALGLAVPAQAAETSGYCGAEGDGSNLTWSYADGVLTISGTGAMKDYSGTEPPPWIWHEDKITSLIIENGVTTVGEHAFHSFDFTSVTLPSTLTNIGRESFYYCRNLERISIPGSVKTIGILAFAECYALTEVTLVEGLESIHDFAFMGSGVERVTIPASVTKIQTTAFSGNESLAEITVSDGNKNYKSIDGILYSADGRTLLVYPAGKAAESFTTPAGVTTVGGGAFDYSVNLKVVTFSEGVETIGYAFAWCESLEEVTIPSSVTYIESESFSDCPLKTANVPCSWDPEHPLYNFGSDVTIYVADHIYENDGICDACGYACTHETLINGLCNTCTTQFVASLTIGEVTTYYTSGDAVFSAAKSAGKGTVTILADAQTTAALYLNSYSNIHLVVNEGATLTLNKALYLNGKVSGSGTIDGDGYFALYSNSTVTGVTLRTESFSNNGSIIGGTFDCSLVNYGVITGGTFSNDVENNDSATISGGTFNKDVTNEGGTITGGTFNGKVTNAGATISGGTFNAELVNTVHDADLPTPGKVINTQVPTTFTLGENFFITNEAAKITCTSHIIADGACRLCGADCPHESVTNTICDACGGTYYGLYMSGELVTPENLSGEGWTYTPAKGDDSAKLVLENAVLGGSEDTTHQGAGIYHVGQDTLVIELKGESTVTGAEVTEESETGLNAYGALHSGGTLTIQGSGTLNALGYYGDNMDNRFVFPGIYTRDLLTISGGTINASGNVGILVGEHDLISKLVISGGTITSTVISESLTSIPSNLAVLGNMEISGGTTTLNGGAIPLMALQMGHTGFPHTIHLTGGSLYLYPDEITEVQPLPLLLGNMELSGYRNYRWTNQEDGPWYFSTPLDAYYGDLLKIEPSPYVQAPAPAADNHYALDVTGLSGDETLTYTWFHAEESIIDTDDDSEIFLVPAQEGDLVRIQANSMEDYPNSYFAVGDAITGTNGLAVLSDNVWIHRVEAADLVTDNGTAYFPVLCARLDPKGDMWDSNLHTDVTITRIRTLDQVEGQTGRNLQAPEAGKYIGMVSICENGTTLATAVTDVVDYVPYSHTGGAATCNQGKVCQVCGTLYDTTLDPENHVQVDETGLCACGEQMIASLTLDGVTTWYTDGYAFQKALVDLPDPSVYSVEIYRDLSAMDFGGSLNFPHGTAQLDLNGFTLDVTLNLDDMNMTVIDSSNGKGTIINDGGYAFYILSGKLTLDASTDCLGTGEGHEAWRILNMTEGQLALGTDIILPEDYLLVNTKTNLPVTSLAVGEMGFPHIHSLSSDYAFDDIQHWQNCTGCDEMLNVQKHSILDIMVGNAHEHWNTCVNCDVVLNKGDHTGGAANCTVPGSCTTCKQVYQSIDADNHDFAEGVCTLCGEPDPNYVPPQPEAPSVEGLTRLAGKDRLITSYLVADQLKAQMNVEKFDAVIVASGKTFADALPGSYLAAAKNAPILLTLPKDQYINQTADYIKANLKAGGTVYILGGTSAVPASMEAALAGFNVQRVAGDDRFKTNLEILKVGGAKAGDEILVCEGKGYADSLSASATGKPILLVYKKLTAEQKAYLATMSGCSFTIVGGTTAVPEALAKEIEAYGSVTRLAGEDRLDTSILVAEKYFKDATTAVVAYGWDFPDGLCGGTLGYATKSPLILAHSKEKLYAFTAEKTDLRAGYVLGGDGLVSDAAIKAIFGADEIKLIK